MSYEVAAHWQIPFYMFHVRVWWYQTYIDWFGLEWTFTNHPVQPPAVGRDPSPPAQAFQSPIQLGPGPHHPPHKNFSSLSLINSNRTFKILLLHNFWNCVCLPRYSWERGSQEAADTIFIWTWLANIVPYLKQWHTYCIGVQTASFLCHFVFGWLNIRVPCTQLKQEQVWCWLLDGRASLVVFIRWRRWPLI